MQELLSLAIRTIFVDNVLLAMFLGMCSFLACSKNIKTASGLGFAVIFVMTLTVPLNWAINHFLLRPGALTWLGLSPKIDLSFLVFIAFIATIATAVQIVEMVLEKFVPPLYTALGIFLPLIAVNCAILGASLFMEQRQYNFSQSVVYGFSAGVGWFLAIIAMAAIQQQKIRYAKVPRGLQGFGINMIITGLMSLAFMAFSGISF